MSSLLLNGKQQFLDVNGNPLVGGKVYFYEVNTTTPKDTWQDYQLTVLNTNPVICDGFGQATIWGAGAYRQVLKDASDNTLWDKVITDASFIGDGELPLATLEDLDANVFLGAIASGPVQQIAMTSAGRTLVAAADAGAQRTALGLGTAAVLNTGTATGNVVQYTAAGSIQLGDGAEATPSLAFSSDTDSGVYRFGANNIGFSTGGVLRMRMDGNGNIGRGDFTNTVGTAALVRMSSDSSFQQAGVNAAIFAHTGGTGKVETFRSGTTEVGNISVTPTATAYNTSSDYRLKQNIKKIDNATELVLKLNPCEYEFKASPDCRIHGVIAHELQAVLPYAVTGEKDGESMQSVDLSKLVPLLTAALQDALQRLEALENARL